MSAISGTLFSGVRVVVSLAGVAAIAWTVSVFPVFRLDSDVARISARVISGNLFREGVWDSIELRLKTLPHQSIKTSSLGKLAVIRLRSVEGELSKKNGPEAQSSLIELTALVKDALRGTPSDGFLWLTLSWISERSGGSTDDRWRFLRSSYRFSANEGWIGLKRNPFVLGHFATLPGDIAEDAVQELMHLTHSKFYAEAAEIIAGPGLSVSKLLLRRMRDLSQDDRAALASSLSNRNGFEDAAKELGIEPPTRRH